MTDPIIRRAHFTSHHADSSGRPNPLFSTLVRPSGEDPSDGPVDGWVDDVDADWDDLDRLPSDRPSGGPLTPERLIELTTGSAPEQIGRDSRAATRGMPAL